MITYFQAAVLGLLQGISELFPISSLGHSVIFPRLVGWHLNQADPFFLTFLVATHFATAAVLFLFFWKDWISILAGLGRSLRDREIKRDDSFAKLGWLLVLGTLPAGIIGLLFKDQLQILFSSARLAALVLIFNGAILYGAELLRRKSRVNDKELKSGKRLAKLTWTQSFKVGLSQVIALIPGFSRSGSTMAGGLLVGLSNEDAARFSFLLATPIIGGAALFSLPEFFQVRYHTLIGPAIVGALCAALGAYFSVKYLVKYFHSNTLTPFAVYCALAGITCSIIFFFR